MGEVVRMQEKEESWIPSISDERLQQLSERIRPVMSLRNKFFFWKRDLWYVKQDERAERATGLKPLCDIKTYHTYIYYAFVMPSIDEVFAQIPDEHLDKVVAFEIVHYPKNIIELNREWEAFNAGYHVAITRLYVREQMES